jgi:hypothetical protein
MPTLTLLQSNKRQYSILQRITKLIGEVDICSSQKKLSSN